MYLDALKIIEIAWTAVGVLWLATSLTTKPAVRVQSTNSRIVHICLLVIAFLIFFNQRLRIGPLVWRFVPASSLVSYIGLALALLGILFTIWARFFIGRDWSAWVTIKQDHRLIRSGPYSIVRHPIYSGILLGLLGTAIVIGELRCLIGLALAVIGFRQKSLIEEHFMAEQFGAEYGRYKRDVKALVPFIW